MPEAKRGYVVGFVDSPEVYYLGSSQNKDQPWVFLTREAAERAAKPSCPKCGTSGRVVECIYYPVEIIGGTDPHSAVKERIEELHAAGETR